MNSLTATVQALTHTVQLQKELGAVVSPSLQTLAREKIKEVEEQTSQQGTLDAIELLKRFEHSDGEARCMASSYGRFLKAASAAVGYTPNTKSV